MKDIGIVYLVDEGLQRFSGETGVGFVGRVPTKFKEVFTFSTSPREFRGIHKLAQTVSKILLTVPGSDKYAPSVGTGIEQIAIMPIGQDGVRLAQRDISIALSITEDQIIKAQRTQSLDFDERLQSLEMVQAKYDFRRGKWDIRIRIISESGRSVAINIPSVTL